jgi:ERCC4-type nuclease
VRNAIVLPYTILIDTREQYPYRFVGIAGDAKDRGLPVIVETEHVALKTGDYSIRGFEEVVTIERKSKADAYHSFGSDRDRFECELDRMLTMEFKCLMIECSEQSLYRDPPPESRLNPKVLYRSFNSWMIRYGLHIRFCDTRSFAERTTFRLLDRFWRFKTSK